MNCFGIGSVYSLAPVQPVIQLLLRGL